MWFESGHHIVMVMNVLEEHFGSVYTGHQMIAAVGPGQIVCADHLDYTVPKLKRMESRIFILYIFHTLSLGYKTLTRVRQYM